jgi:hypothetical protein
MVTNNAWNSEDPAQVAKGGTGNSSTTAYAVQCGGTTSTGAHQPIASVGTAGQVLTSNGAGALPTFQAAPGSWVLIEAQTASTSATIDFTTGIDSTYDTYVLVWNSLKTDSVSSTSFRMLFSVNGGSSYLTTGYASAINAFEYTTNAWIVNSTNRS